MYKKIVVVIAVLTILMTGCTRDISKIRVVGSTSMQPISEALAAKYQASHSGTKVIVEGGDSELGMRSILGEIAEVGSVSRIVTKAEEEKINKYILAEGHISIIVNKKNKLQYITISQLAAVFKGEITNWKQLGGSDASIGAISREEGSGTYNSFHEIVAKGKKEVFKNVAIMPSTGAVRAVVAQDINAIGYISSSYLNNEVRVLPIVNNEHQVIQLKRPLIYVVGKDPDSQTSDFIKFVLSDTGRKIVNSLLLD